MSTTQHIPEPWTLTHDERPELGGAFFTIRDSKGGPLAIVLDPDQDSTEDGDTAAAEEGNAKRILTCVNLLAGIPQSALQIILERFPNDAGARQRYLIDTLSYYGNR